MLCKRTIVAASLVLAAVRLTLPVQRCLLWERRVLGPTGPGKFHPIVDVCSSAQLDYVVTGLQVVAVFLVTVALLLLLPQSRVHS